MNLHQLWFVRYDAMVLTRGASLENFAKLLPCATTQLTDSSDSDIQMHLYELLRTLDDFMELERITTWFMMQADNYSDRELTQAEQAITQIQLQLQLQKSYANELWINRKLDWNVQIRILATLCRLFVLLVTIHIFLVGNFPTLWHRAKSKRLIVPLDRTEVLSYLSQKFANSVFKHICGTEEFYYRYEYPYIRDIHQLLEAYRKLLSNFHKVAKQQLPLTFSVFEVILTQNKKYSRILTEKSIRNATTKRQVQDRILNGFRHGQKSQQPLRRKPIEFALQYGYRKRRTQSQNDIYRIEQAKKSPTQIAMVNLKDRRKTHWTVSMRSNTEYTVSRDVLQNRPYIKQSSTSREADSSQAKSRVSSRWKVASRRTVISSKIKNRAIIKESKVYRKIEFPNQVLVETESPDNEIKTFYDAIKDISKQQLPLKVCVSNRTESPKKKLEKYMKLVSSKFEYISQRTEAVVQSKSTFYRIKPAQCQRKNCY